MSVQVVVDTRLQNPRLVESNLVYLDEFAKCLCQKHGLCGSKVISAYNGDDLYHVWETVDKEVAELCTRDTDGVKLLASMHNKHNEESSLVELCGLAAEIVFDRIYLHFYPMHMMSA